MQCLYFFEKQILKYNFALHKRNTLDIIAEKEERREYYGYY